MPTATVYTSTHRAHCSRVKSYLREQGIEFEERNIDTDEDYARELAEMGLMAVPVTIIGETKILGFNPDRMKRALSAQVNHGTMSVHSVAKVGLPAPGFRLSSTKNPETLNEPVRLEDYKGKWLVLFFWPFDFTFVCPTEIIAFSDRYDEFLDLDCEIVGVSVDSVYTHRAWMNTPRDRNGIGPIRYPLASDIAKETARAYGVLDEQSGAAHRGLFIIDPEGVIRYQVVTDMNVGRSVDETLRILQALQAGGLCPANWKPGQATLNV